MWRQARWPAESGPAAAGERIVAFAPVGKPFRNAVLRPVDSLPRDHSAGDFNRLLGFPG